MYEKTPKSRLLLGQIFVEKIGRIYHYRLVLDEERALSICGLGRFWHDPEMEIVPIPDYVELFFDGSGSRELATAMNACGVVAEYFRKIIRKRKKKLRQKQEELPNHK